MIGFIFGLFLCVTPNGPCQMVQGPYSSAADCAARLRQFAGNLPIRNGVLAIKQPGMLYNGQQAYEYYLCLKRPTSEWSPDQ